MSNRLRKTKQKNNKINKTINDDYYILGHINTNINTQKTTLIVVFFILKEVYEI